MQLYRAWIVHSLSKTRVQSFRDGGMVVAHDGSILALGEYHAVRKEYPRAKVSDYSGRVILPGLIDCHIHLPQLDQRGRHGATLLDWLQQFIFPAEKAFADVGVAEEVGRRFFKKLILNGTTTAAVFSTIHHAATTRAFELAQASGLRIIMGKVMMDQNSPRGLLESTRQSLRESEDLCSRWHQTVSEKLHYAFTPRFAPTCSAELWRDTATMLQQSGAYLQTHIAETQNENTWVRELFPRYEDYVELFEDFACLTPRTILAHAIHMSDSEYARVAHAGCGVAHCPLSNFFLKSGRMPVEALDAAGVRYGYGTDVGAGPSMSMFAVMRHADYMQPQQSITPKQALFRATLGGAQCLRLEHQVGNFRRGKAADFIVIDIAGIDLQIPLAELDVNSLLSLLMYRGDSRTVSETFVAGERLDVDGF